MKTKMKRKIGIYAVIFCLMITLLPVSVFANPNNTGQASTNVAQNIPEGAITLSTPEDVMTFAENCRTNTWSIGKTVVLLNDIDMKGTKFKGIPTFGGVFMGQGYTISGLNMNHDSSVIGFFRYLQKSAKVENLIIKGSYSFEEGHRVIGGFVGRNSGRIVNCTFDGIVGGAEQVGGFAGVNETTGVIESCNVSGTIYGNHFVGGFTGVNHGVVRSCKNSAKINTDSSHNKVGIGQITLDSMKQTENASAATDIGGITGKNSGVIRSCTNTGNVGYQHMGYNVGGIAGTQNGYIVDCSNYGYIQGSKEVGGIVGQLEPNIILKYDTDSIQIITGQVNDLSASVDQVSGSIQNSNNAITNQVQNMKDGVEDVKTSLAALNNAKNDPSADNDKVIAAQNDYSSSMQSLLNQGQGLTGTINNASNNTIDGLQKVTNQLNKTAQTIGSAGENLKVTVIDKSGEDTDADTLGKVSNCYNYANIKADKNVGGIAGLLDEENDLNVYQDVEVYGESTLNATYLLRAVVRDCVNYGTIEVKKDAAGGIAGKMSLGAVLECINVGNLNAINADYIGGIAGDSNAIIRNSSAKCVIAGDTYVGGIAGRGNEVIDCYAFVDIKSFVEKAGAIIGLTNDLPDGAGDLILRNYYYNAGKETGGIDGITYTGATDRIDVASFLQLPHLSDLFRTVTVRFITEGKDDIVYTLNVGESLALDMVPTVDENTNYEYEWELLSVIATEVLGMGETETKEYLTEKTISNVLFDQTYKMTMDIKDNVVSTEQRNEKNLPLVLAEGLFSKYTTIELLDTFSTGVITEVNKRDVIESWNIAFSNPGVKKVHYLISDELNPKNLVLYIQDNTGNWVRRDFEIEGGYIIFEFADGEAGFALRETSPYLVLFIILLILLVAADVLMILYVKKRKNSKH